MWICYQSRTDFGGACLNVICRRRANNTPDSVREVLRSSCVRGHASAGKFWNCIHRRTWETIRAAHGALKAATRLMWPLFLRVGGLRAEGPPVASSRFDRWRPPLLQLGRALRRSFPSGVADPCLGMPVTNTRALRGRADLGSFAHLRRNGFRKRREVLS